MSFKVLGFGFGGAPLHSFDELVDGSITGDSRASED